MARVLLGAQPGMGHVNPLIAIARRLGDEGHEVAFALPRPGPEAPVRAVEAGGIAVRPVRPPLSTTALALLPWTSGFLETSVAMRLFAGGLVPHARAFRVLLDQWRPDVVVADFALPALPLAAEASGLPVLTIYHAGLAYRGPGIPPFGSGLPVGETRTPRARTYRRLESLVAGSIARSIRGARRALGLPAAEPGPSWWTSPWATLVLTVPEAEAPRDPLPPCTFYAGPCFAGRRGPPFDFDRLDPHRKRIYVSLGTVFDSRPAAFSKILEAFADGRHQLVVSAGASYRRLASRPLPPGALLCERVPQPQILPRVDAVISHGGNNTVNESLAAGRPLLVLPVGGEQGDNASRVVHLGAGLRARIRCFTPGELRAKTDRILGEPSFRDAAARVAAAFARTDGVATAAAFAARLAAVPEPIPRPDGHGETLDVDRPRPWDFETG